MLRRAGAGSGTEGERSWGLLRPWINPPTDESHQSIELFSHLHLFRRSHTTTPSSFNDQTLLPTNDLLVVPHLMTPLVRNKRTSSKICEIEQNLRQSPCSTMNLTVPMTVAPDFTFASAVAPARDHDHLFLNTFT